MTSDDSVYRPPGGPPERSASGTARSLEAAMAGDYRLDLGSILSEAWTLTNGSKTVILGAVLTLGIGLIWLWPWGTMVFAILYREIFGYSGRG